MNCPNCGHVTRCPSCNGWLCEACGEPLPVPDSGDDPWEYRCERESDVH